METKAQYLAIDPKTGLVVREANEYEIAIFTMRGYGRKACMVGNYIIDEKLGDALPPFITEN
ncbi:MAG: hypothetical protein WC069_06570 [Candidatus Shapirobacteria bacterium]